MDGKIKNNKDLKKYQGVIFLIVILLILSFLKIKYRNVEWEEGPAMITPTVTPTRAPQINENYPLWNEIPFEGKGFVVDHYTEPLVLTVNIETLTDKKVVTEEIYNWMRENKVATESHKLVFEINK